MAIQSKKYKEQSTKNQERFLPSSEWALLYLIGTILGQQTLQIRSIIRGDIRKWADFIDVV